MTTTNEQSFQSGACVLVIVHEQNAKRSMGRFSGAVDKTPGRLARRHGFHGECKCRSLSLSFAVRGERGAVSFGERFRNGQAQTKAAETPLKRTVALFEGIEHALHDFGFDADPGIAHSDDQSL